MDLSPNQFDDSQFLAATRKDGCSPEIKARFLSLLAETGNVRLAAQRCGISAQSAYVHRRRDPLFARGWDAALVLALGQAEQVLADRAIEGVEEPIWYRGELVGTRRRYDNRLLLAHLARLDRQTERAGTADDAGRFDELVALVAGAAIPDVLERGEDGLPCTREVCTNSAAEDARWDAVETLPVDGGQPCEDREAAVDAIAEAAHAEAGAAWDGWFDLVCETVERLGDSSSMDRVNVSTSAPLDPPRHGEE
jgi:hypothetical protein